MHAGCETGGNLVAAAHSRVLHRYDDLQILDAHELQVFVLEPVLREDLQEELYKPDRFIHVWVDYVQVVDVENEAAAFLRLVNLAVYAVDNQALCLDTIDQALCRGRGIAADVDDRHVAHAVQYVLNDHLLATPCTARKYDVLAVADQRFDQVKGLELGREANHNVFVEQLVVVGLAGRVLALFGPRAVHYMHREQFV